MLPIAVDAMGGDRAPDEILAAAHAAVELGIPVALVGPADLQGRGDLELIPASEVIEMHDDAAQGVRRKKDSTLVRAAEAVRDGKTGLLVPPRDVKALSSALSYLMTHDELRTHMGHAALERARREFGIDRMLDGMEAVFADAAGAR